MTNLLNHERVQQILKNVPALLRKFAPEDFRGFLMTGDLETYPAGEIILSESSDEISDAWLITDGKLSIWKDGIEVAQLDAGDFIGETFLFSNGFRIATVKAETDCAMIRFERDAVLRFFRTRPERVFKLFIMNLLEIQQKRLTAMNSKVARLQRKLIDCTGGLA
ncbi:cyclic nucleotide-binding domain-containing protein [Balneolales bacterium ANBcel1]|nr:cyclic nucleotide-binding domain-containing protein [Balneolales bacterium ANBcel1]